MLSSFDPVGVYGLVVFEFWFARWFSHAGNSMALLDYQRILCLAGQSET